MKKFIALIIAIIAMIGMNTANPAKPAGTQKRTGKASQDTGRGAEASEAFFPRQG